MSYATTLRALTLAAALLLAACGMLIAARPSEAEEARTRANAVKIAKEYFGTPYKYGGTTSKGMDCSGLVYRVFHYRLGMTNVPRTSRDQWKWSGAVGRVSLADTKPGDLVFSDFDRNGTVDHVGIATIKDGKIQQINATRSGEKLRITPIYKEYYIGTKRWLRK